MQYINKPTKQLDPQILGLLQQQAQQKMAQDEVYRQERVVALGTLIDNYGGLEEAAHVEGGADLVKEFFATSRFTPEQTNQFFANIAAKKGSAKGSLGGARQQIWQDQALRQQAAAEANPQPVAGTVPAPPRISTKTTPLAQLLFDPSTIEVPADTGAGTGSDGGGGGSWGAENVVDIPFAGVPQGGSSVEKMIRPETGPTLMGSDVYQAMKGAPVDTTAAVVTTPRPPVDPHKASLEAATKAAKAEVTSANTIVDNYNATYGKDNYSEMESKVLGERSQGYQVRHSKGETAADIGLEVFWSSIPDGPEGDAIRERITGGKNLIGAVDEKLLSGAETQALTSIRADVVKREAQQAENIQKGKAFVDEFIQNNTPITDTTTPAGRKFTEGVVSSNLTAGTISPQNMAGTAQYISSNPGDAASVVNYASQLKASDPDTYYALLPAELGLAIKQTELAQGDADITATRENNRIISQTARKMEALYGNDAELKDLTDLEEAQMYANLYLTVSQEALNTAKSRGDGGAAALLDLMKGLKDVLAVKGLDDANAETVNDILGQATTKLQVVLPGIMEGLDVQMKEGGALWWKNLHPETSLTNTTAPASTTLSTASQNVIGKFK